VSRVQHGYGGHFAAWPDCLFHLHTTVNGRWRVSTVGDYRPTYRARGEARLALAPEGLGGGGVRLFESMVFMLAPNGGVRSWTEIRSAAYDCAADADEGHEALCAEYEAMVIPSLSE
jgi:hypothetical protein